MLPVPVHTYLIAGAVGGLILTIGTWHATATYKDAVWSDRLSTYQLEIKSLHEANLRQIEGIEKASADWRRTLETKNMELRDEISTLYTKNAALASSRGLWDNGQGGQASGVEVSRDYPSGCSACPSANGRLSGEASDFLLAEAYRADQLALYAATCYEWLRN